jgi:hypothetical protein
LPFLDADAPLVAQVLKDICNSGFAAVGELEGAVVRVQDPSQHLFALVPAPISFGKLLLGDRLFAIWVVLVRPGKHVIDGMQDAEPRVAAAAPRPLGYPDEVVHKDVDVCHWTFDFEERGPVVGSWSRRWQVRNGRGHRSPRGQRSLFGSGFGWGRRSPIGLRSCSVADGFEVVLTGFGWGRRSPSGWRLPGVMSGR